MGRGWRTAAVLALAAGLGLAHWWTEAATPTAAQSGAAELDATQVVARVEVEAAREVRTRPRHVFHGVVRSAQRARLAFTQSGRLLSRPVQVGDEVQAGQVLARLDAGGQRNAVTAARASARELDLQREQLERDQARTSTLAARGSVAQAQLEQTESGLERVEAMRSAAQAQLSESLRRNHETVLRAPFSGVITDVLVEPGELAQAGQPVLRLAGHGGYEVALAVPPELARQLGEGDPVELMAVGLAADDPVGRHAARGHVRSISRGAADLSGHHPVIVTLDEDPAIRAGLGVEAVLFGSPRAALRVPLAAVLDPSGQRPFAWRLVDGRIERAWLRLGRLEGDQVEVRDGLAPGDQVVVRGQARLLEGDRAEVGGAS